MTYLLEPLLIKFKLYSSLFGSQHTKGEFNFNFIATKDEVTNLAQYVTQTREHHVFRQFLGKLNCKQGIVHFLDWRRLGRMMYSSLLDLETLYESIGQNEERSAMGLTIPFPQLPYKATKTRYSSTLRNISSRALSNNIHTFCFASLLSIQVFNDCQALS